jgi:hypothetical protein
MPSDWNLKTSRLETICHPHFVPDPDPAVNPKSEVAVDPQPAAVRDRATRSSIGLRRSPKFRDE